MEIYDALEQGRAREMPNKFTETVPKCEEVQRMVRCRFVKASKKKEDNNTQYRMYREDDESFFLYARLNKQRNLFEIFPYAPEESSVNKKMHTQLYKLSKPMFTFAISQSRNSYVMWSAKCEHCFQHLLKENCIDEEASNAKISLGQQLLYIEHHLKDLNSQWMHAIKVLIPAIDEQNNTKSILCARTLAHELTQNSLKDPDYAFRQIFPDMKDYNQNDTIYLTTRDPEWNARQKSWAIDSQGRMRKASKRNFQVMRCGDAEKNVLLQVGKVDKDQYIVDYKYPFSFVQAMGLALSTFNWKTKINKNKLPTEQNQNKKK